MGTPALEHHIIDYRLQTKRYMLEKILQNTAERTIIKNWGAEEDGRDELLIWSSSNVDTLKR